ncbi:fasciclin domain-containing protein [Brevundimonas sp.]
MTFNTTRLALVAALAAGAMTTASCGSMDGMDSMSSGAEAQGTVMVGGAAMYPTKNIVENAVNSRDHTTLVAAVTAAGLVPTLSGPGPFTVFAPTNAAFAKLPAGTVDTLVQPANRATLTKILTYHVVPGRVSAADLMAQIRAGGGQARLTTVEGGTLTASMRGSSVILTDEKGGVATVTQADVFQSNGVIHVTDTVSIPN